MRLLLDAMYAARIAAILSDRGVDAAAIDGVRDLVGLADDAVLDRARAEERAVVTENHADFCRIGRTAVADGRGHHGLVLVPAHRREIGWLVRTLERIAKDHVDGDALRDRELWL